jgi:hypothetical protein
MNEVITCDKCKSDGCIVNEVLPPSKPVSMSDYARRGKSPFSLGYTQRIAAIPRKWEISCPECGYSIEFHEHTTIPTPFFKEANT